MNTLHIIRSLIIEHIIKNKITFDSNLEINENFDIIEYIDQPETNLCSINGKTMIKTLEWEKSVEGIKFAKKINVEYIAIRLTNNNNQPLPIESIIYTFLHELSHTITLPRIQNSSKLNKETKSLQPFVKNENKKIPNHHPLDFYKSLSKILRIADELGIYQLPKQYKNFNLKNIQRYDKMINPDDKILLGYSEKFSY